MYPISIEEQTRTHRWPNWVFQFLIRVTEVNVNLANHDIHKQDIMYEVTIMWEFSVEIINNSYLTINKCCRANICDITE